MFGFVCCFYVYHWVCLFVSWLTTVKHCVSLFCWASDFCQALCLSVSWLTSVRHCVCLFVGYVTSVGIVFVCQLGDFCKALGLSVCWVGNLCWEMVVIFGTCTAD